MVVVVVVGSDKGGKGGGREWGAGAVSKQKLEVRVSDYFKINVSKLSIWQLR